MLQILEQGGVRTPSLRDMEEADAVLVLGEDVTQNIREGEQQRAAIKDEMGWPNGDPEQFGRRDIRDQEHRNKGDCDDRERICGGHLGLSFFLHVSHCAWFHHGTNKGCEGRRV